jgi:hypothetical protein
MPEYYKISLVGSPGSYCNKHLFKTLINKNVIELSNEYNSSDDESLLVYIPNQSDSYCSTYTTIFGEYIVFSAYIYKNDKLYYDNEREIEIDFNIKDSVIIGDRIHVYMPKKLFNGSKYYFNDDDLWKRYITLGKNIKNNISLTKLYKNIKIKPSFIPIIISCSKELETKNELDVYEDSNELTENISFNKSENIECGNISTKENISIKENKDSNFESQSKDLGKNKSVEYKSKDLGTNKSVEYKSKDLGTKNEFVIESCDDNNQNLEEIEYYSGSILTEKKIKEHEYFDLKKINDIRKIFVTKKYIDNIISQIISSNTKEFLKYILEIDEDENLIKNIKCGLLKHFIEKKSIFPVFLETKFVDLNIVDYLYSKNKYNSQYSTSYIQDISRKFLKEATKEMFDSDKIPDSTAFKDLTKLFKLSFKKFKMSDEYN